MTRREKNWWLLGYDAVERVASSNSRVTLGKTYTLNSDGSIYDDRGRKLTPAFNARFWKGIGTPSSDARTVNDNGNDNDNDNERSGEMSLSIETVTLVNGARAETLSVETFLDMIEREKACIERIKNSGVTESTALNSICKKHRENIGQLVELLDKVVCRHCGIAADEVDVERERSGR